MASEMVIRPNPDDVPVKPGRIPADDLAAIAARYRAGESLKLIGQSYGVTDEAVRQRLEKWALAGHGDTEFGQMVTDYLVENAIQAKDRMVQASDVLGLARGREEVRYWLWMLERRRPKLYGPKQHVEQDTSVTITINRLTPAPAVNAPITVTGSLVDHSGNEADGSAS